MNGLETLETVDYVSSLRWIIHPDSKLKKSWDIVLIILLFYVAIIMPYRIGFIDGTVYDNW